MTPDAATADKRRSRFRRASHVQPWTGLGPIHSLRGGLLLVTALAITPLMLFASGMALLRAQEEQRLPSAAAWLTVAALPLLIGVAAILIVSLAWEAMVMHWLTYLERVSRAYAHGRYSVRPRRLHDAPTEFQALGQAVEEMASAVEHRDHALREALDEQTVLLREVHHRVKNNLQIVTSLLSLDAAGSRDPAARCALQDALIRVDAMSLGQRFMQQQEEEELVSAVELFEGFVAQARARMNPGRSLDLVADVAPGVLPLETGSRLVLLAAEAVIGAVRVCPGAPSFQLALRFEPGFVVLRLTSPTDPDAFCGLEQRLSGSLVKGYVRQLRGRLEAPPGEGRLVVRAPLAPPEAPPAADELHAQSPRLFRVSGRTGREVGS